MTLAGFLSKASSLWGLIDTRGIDRFRPVLIAMQIGLFMIASLFWMDTQLNGDSFSPETWGEWACGFPAEMWAGAMIAASTLCVSGLMHPVTKVRIIIGAFIHVLQFFALSLSAALTGGQFVIAVFPLVLLVPMHIILAWEAAVYDPDGNT